MENRFKSRFWNAETNKMIYNVYVGQESIIVPSNINPMNMGECDFYNPKFIGKKLMQCTGLSDKNGKLIFEGDILEFDNDDRVIIKCENDYIYFYCDPIGEPELEDQWRDLYRIRDAKIIGNIHQNPELIKGE